MALMTPPLAYDVTLLRNAIKVCMTGKRCHADKQLSLTALVNDPGDICFRVRVAVKCSECDVSGFPLFDL